MKTTRLTLVIRSLNYLVDQQVKYSVDDIYKQINDGTVFDKLRAAYVERYDAASRRALLAASTSVDSMFEPAWTSSVPSGLAKKFLMSVRPLFVVSGGWCFDLQRLNNHRF